MNIRDRQKDRQKDFVHEKEIVAEDDQVFLMKQQSQLAKQPPSSAGRPARSRFLTDVQAELERISRKPDMPSPTSPTSPTENEAS
ncbi:unnamed protein product [Ranitomeya imitator]|uniref:Uncharacterized protein n=1 Tax=Ranitomeya imitator TaxID=111125 RepID=A0ABN9M9W2_9NEOB|nr:unnamed protein product [Ranitomeya imitator]